MTNAPTPTPTPIPTPPDAMDFGRRLPAGIGINLLVSDVARSVSLQAALFGVTVEYQDTHFAALRFNGSRILLHSDWSYRNHPFGRAVEGVVVRGQGVELRLYGADPDRAESLARSLDVVVVCAATDKEHGLREAYLMDPDGYVWVPSRPLPCAGAE